MNMIDFRAKLNKIFGNDNVELDVSDNDFVLLKIISDNFKSKNRSERINLINEIHEKELGGIAQLYSVEEANLNNIRINPTIEPARWANAINFIASGQKIKNKKTAEKTAKKIVFYSYKGGVGRTTSLIQTAFNLTRNGKRVVLIDMDFEAPGLQTSIPPQYKTLDYGLVDYLWERQNKIDDSYDVNLNSVENKGIVYSVEDSLSRRSLFVIPSGKISDRYVQRLSSLSIDAIFGKKESIWMELEKEIIDNYLPDIILIDARTGLNDWGASTLLKIADEVFIVMYPSLQNIEGIDYIVHTLKSIGGFSPKFIFSPIPEGVAGKILSDNVKKKKNYLSEDVVEVFYNPNVSLSDSFPVEQALSDYAKVSNIILEIEEGRKNSNVFSDLDYREWLIRSLKYPKENAEQIKDIEFDLNFQKTADFDLILDDQSWIVRGRKGTGKSTLYSLFTKYVEKAKKLAHGRLDNITTISGHGLGDNFRPTLDVFETIQKSLSETNTDWVVFWRIYALIKIFRANSCCEVFRANQKLFESLKQFSSEHERWTSNHTSEIVKMSSSLEVVGFFRDALQDCNIHLQREIKKIWLFYDDLDQDIKENSSWQQDAIGGLMRFVYDANNINAFNIRFKIFLREDIWGKLIFTNKSHFGTGRTILLKWETNDFLRLVYRLTVKNSPEFQSVANRLMPISEHQINDADEETLRMALAPLWGLKRKGKNAYTAQWIYSRLTDASENTYPRSLTILLNRAKEFELEQSIKTAPTDHLLRWSSLTEGLKSASKERCNAIKNEYEDLRYFFSKIEDGQLGSLFTKEELKLIWQSNIDNHDDDNFESFVKKLDLIGLISKKKGNAKYDYAIANLYIDGFGIRTQGQRK